MFQPRHAYPPYAAERGRNVPIGTNGASARRTAPQRLSASGEAVVGNIFEDVWGTVTEPSVLLHAIPFMGWTTILLDLFEGAGIIAKGADVALHLTPGLVQGESFSDAFMADYGTRLKIAAGYVLGAAIAGASAAAGAILKAGGGAALDQAIEKAKQEIGEEAVEQIRREAEERIDREMNQAYQRAVEDAGLSSQLDRARIDALRTKGLSTAGALAEMGLSPGEIASRLGIREDVAALAVNALLHERVYDVARFDVATGRAPGPVGEVEAGPLRPPDRSSAFLYGKWQEALATWRGAVLDAQQRRARGEDATEALAFAESAGRVAETKRARYEAALADEQEKAAREKALHEARARALADASRGGVVFGSTSPGRATGATVTAGAGLLGKALTLALLTSPAWGAVIGASALRRFRRRG